MSDIAAVQASCAAAATALEQLLAQTSVSVTCSSQAAAAQLRLANALQDLDQRVREGALLGVTVGGEKPVPGALEEMETRARTLHKEFSQVNNNAEAILREFDRVQSKQQTRKAAARR